jgi:hypothetical protein
MAHQAKTFVVSHRGMGSIASITGSDLSDTVLTADLESAKRHALLKQHGFEVAVSSER